MKKKDIWKGTAQELEDWIADGNELPVSADEDITVIAGEVSGSADKSGAPDEMMSGEPGEGESEEESRSSLEEAVKEALGKDPAEEKGKADKHKKSKPGSGGFMMNDGLPGKIKLPPPNPHFTMRLKSIFKDNALNRLVGNKRYGNLDFKRLHKITTTGKIFSRKDSIGGKRYNILMLIDTSGSMSGHRDVIAGAAAFTLIRDFQKLVNISAYTFNERVVSIKEPDMIVKEHDLPGIADVVVKETRQGPGGNHDPLALLEGYDILKREIGEKVMIVISDGEPACGCSKCRHIKNMNAYTKEVADKIEHSGIPILSIGIQTSSVADYYQNYIIIDNPEDLYDSMLKLLSKTIRRRAVK